MSPESEKILYDLRNYHFTDGNIGDIEDFLVSKEKYLENKSTKNLADTNIKFEVVLSILKQKLSYERITLETYNLFQMFVLGRPLVKQNALYAFFKK